MFKFWHMRLSVWSLSLRSESEKKFTPRAMKIFLFGLHTQAPWNLRRCFIWKQTCNTFSMVERGRDVFFSQVGTNNRLFPESVFLTTLSTLPRCVRLIDPHGQKIVEPTIQKVQKRRPECVTVLFPGQAKP